MNYRMYIHNNGTIQRIGYGSEESIVYTFDDAVEVAEVYITMLEPYATGVKVKPKGYSPGTSEQIYEIRAVTLGDYEADIHIEIWPEVEKDIVFFPVTLEDQSKEVELFQIEPPRFELLDSDGEIVLTGYPENDPYSIFEAMGFEMEGLAHGGFYFPRQTYIPSQESLIEFANIGELIELVHQDGIKPPGDNNQLKMANAVLSGARKAKDLL